MPETILQVGAYSRGDLFEGGLLNLLVWGSAKHNILYYFLHYQIAVSLRFDSYKAHPQCGKGEGASKLNMNSERISNILCKKLVAKKNTLKHFKPYVDRDGINKGKVVKTAVQVKY